jgi:hypothetical protein
MSKQHTGPHSLNSVPASRNDYGQVFLFILYTGLNTLSPPAPSASPWPSFLAFVTKTSPQTNETVTTKITLQGVLEELVHPRDLGRDAEVDGAVANLDDQAADDFGVDLFTLVRLRLIMYEGSEKGGRTWLVTLSFLPWPT